MRFLDPRSLADRMQRLIARSPALVRLAILVRNQARCIIKYHLAESPDVNETGEVWLREAVAREGERFVDIGANVGDWLAGVRAIKGDSAFHALAIEPSSSALPRLHERFANDPRIEVVEAAAGDRPGELAFLEEPAAGKGSTLVPGLGHIDGRTRTVAVVTLDEVMERRGWERADMVKIDAEGYDARVVRGGERVLTRRAVGVVQFEYNRSWQIAGETLHGLYRFFEERGYRVFLLKREGLYDLDYARYEEYFEYSNFVALDREWLMKLSAYTRGTI